MKRPTNDNAAGPGGRPLLTEPAPLSHEPGGSGPGFFKAKGIARLNGRENWDRGTYVRSYDFERRRDCWVEGRVVGFVIYEGVPRYLIDVERREVEGKPTKVERPWIVMPVCNGVAFGLSIHGSDYTEFVEKVEPAAEASP